VNPEEQPSHSSSRHAEGVATKRILLVEDDRMLRDMITLDLQDEGMAVETASDGELALEMIKANPPDLLLLDILMPKKDGFAVLQFLQEEGYNFPVVMISNLSSPDEAEKCKQLGARDFIVKSELDVGDLWKKIKHHFS
jgi:DNA-binding response OmpR family regulator